MSATRAITKLDYLIDQDGSSAFSSKILNLALALSAVNWQLKWASGVKGIFVWEASIYPDPYTWEPLVACEKVELEIEGAELSGIVSLPNQWLTAGFVRFRFEPLAGSTGLIQAAIRIVPT